MDSTTESGATSRPKLGCVLGVVEFLTVAACGAAVATALIITWTWTDGYAPSYYDAGNRMAINLAWVVSLPIVIPIVLLAHYLMAESGRRGGRWFVPALTLLWWLGLFAADLAWNCWDFDAAC